MNISFGKKIPIAECQIQNKKTGEYEAAKVFELDCKNYSDLQETKLPDDEWLFANRIHQNMRNKYFFHRFKKDKSFYILQRENGETLGLCQVNNPVYRNYNLTFLDTKISKEHKFVGQTLLASVSQQLLKKDAKEFTVLKSLSSARSFYKDTCGFTKNKFDQLSLDRDGMQSFIRQTEERTQSPIMDLKG